MHRNTGAPLRARIRPSLAAAAALSAAALTVSPADAFGATHTAATTNAASTTAAAPAAKPAAKPATRHKAKRRHARKAHHFVVPASMVKPMRALRGCESGGNYRTNTGNGFYGAYQFDYGTWRGLGYAGVASDAPAWKQDQAVVRLHAQRGWQPWPACSRYLGLS
ncbi:MAG TPA: transglycosylase family protein [Mycobacteriales bacterium]|nr:transglycosylase family protein [Mycobacteriales bacterium]